MKQEGTSESPTASGLRHSESFYKWEKPFGKGGTVRLYWWRTGGSKTGEAKSNNGLVKMVKPVG